MSDAILTTLITTTPAVLWIVFAAVVFLVLRPQLIMLLSRLRSANVLFGSFDFAAALEEVADTVAGRAAKYGNAPSLADRRAVAGRLEFTASLLKGIRILWVDDHPESNRALIRVFEKAGMTVRTARSTAEGLAEARLGQIDLVITDLRRGDASDAGYDLVSHLVKEEIDAPVILYTLAFDPLRGVHPGIFGYTTAYDELIHLVIDVVERLRFTAPDRGHPISSPYQAPARAHR